MYVVQSEVTSTVIKSPAVSCRLRSKCYSIVVASFHSYLSSVVSDDVKHSLTSDNAVGGSSEVDD